MIVHIPSPLRSYTGNKSTVDASGDTLLELLDDLNKHYKGIKFRMIDEQNSVRPHIRIFVNKEQTNDLGVRLEPNHEVHIIAALSGG